MARDVEPSKIEAQRARLVTFLQGIWARTPQTLRPSLAIFYVFLCAIVVRGLAAFMDWTLHDDREFRIPLQALGILFVAAELAGLAFGVARSLLPSSGLRPWLLGQVASWVFWCSMEVTVHVIKRTGSLWNPSFVGSSFIVGFGILVGFVLWAGQPPDRVID